MNQLAISQTPYSFASSNSLACEEAFYTLASTIAQSESPPLLKTATLTDIIRQTLTTISEFCKLPSLSIQMEPDYSNVDEINFSNPITSAMRGETKEGLPYLAFKSLIQNPSSKTSTPSYVLIGMKNDFKWIKSITNIGQVTEYDHNKEFTQMSPFLQKGKQLPMSFFGLKGDSSVQIKQQIEPKYSETTNCENQLLGNIGMSGISKNVSDFIIQAMGGIKELCLTPRVSANVNSKDLDSIFTLKKDPIIRANLFTNVSSIVFRLCRVGYSYTPGLAGSSKVTCFSGKNEKSTAVKDLESSVGSQYFKDRSQNPMFVVIEINKKLSEVNLTFGNRHQTRSLTDKDLESLKKLKSGNISTISGLLPKRSVSHDVMLDQPHSGNK